MLELQVVLATLVGRFNFTMPPGAAAGDGAAGASTAPSAAPSPGAGVQSLDRLICYYITMFPRDGLRLVATLRTAAD